MAQGNADDNCFTQGCGCLILVVIALFVTNCISQCSSDLEHGNRQVEEQRKGEESRKKQEEIRKLEREIENLKKERESTRW